MGYQFRIGNNRKISQLALIDMVHTGNDKGDMNEKLMPN